MKKIITTFLFCIAAAGCAVEYTSEESVAPDAGNDDMIKLTLPVRKINGSTNPPPPDAAPPPPPPSLALVTPDAGVDDLSQRKNIEALTTSSSGRKGGETVPCGGNCE